MEEDNRILYHRRLGRLRRILYEGKDACRKHLDELLETPVLERIQLVRPRFQTLFAVIAETLARASVVYGFEPDKERDFYFWPGYIIRPMSAEATSSPAERLTLWDSSGRSSGIGYIVNPQGELTHPYNACDTTEWYDHLLTEHDGDTLAGRAFVPAGMHPWTFRSATPPTIGSARVPLSVVAVEVTDMTQSVPEFCEDYGQITIRLDLSDRYEAGHHIAACLNSSPDLNYSVLWPCPPRPNECFRRNATLNQCQKHTQWAWRLLYNIWLGVTFDPDWRKNPAWIEDIQQELIQLGLTGLPSRITSAITSQPATTPHKLLHWYTILLDRIAGLGNTDELGSAMLLCSRKIDKEFFVLVRPWIEEIYLLMRHVENMTRNQSMAELNAQQKAEAERQRAAADTQRTLAAYARGASHSLKNALATPGWRLRTANNVYDNYTGKGGWGDQFREINRN